VIQARVPTDGEWSEAAARVRGEHRPGDLVVVAPFWADPLLRLHLGDALDFASSGHHDLAPFDRLWVLSLRGHRHGQEPEVEADLTERFGQVTVRRYDLGDSPVVYDFVAHVNEAQVSMTEGGVERACPLRRGVARGGSGLFQGPMTPPERFVCDPRRAWLWVGATVMEDLDLRPRHCIWNHPLGLEPIAVRFRDVPLGTELVLHGGIYWDHERYRRGGPVHIAVRVNGEEVGAMTHRDGDGFKRMVSLTRPAGAVGPQRGDVTFLVTAPEPHHRTFCWSATTRDGERAEGP